MFDRNNYINWAKTAQKDNSTMQDFRSSHFNPMNQVQVDEVWGQVAKTVAVPVLKKIGKAVATDVATDVATKGTQKAIEVARDKINKKPKEVKTEAKQNQLKRRNIDPKKLGTGHAIVPDTIQGKPNPKQTKESVELDEIGPLGVVVGGLAGYGAVKLGQAGMRRQKKSIEKRAQASADAYGGSTDRPYNFGDKRREQKEKEKAQTENVEEGVIGGMVKAGLAGAALYGGVKAGKAIHNKWRAKQAATQASNAEDTPSTPPSKQGGEVIGKAVQKAKNYASERIKKDPAARKLATKGLEKGSGLAKKASGWLARKAAGMAAASK